MYASWPLVGVACVAIAICTIWVRSNKRNNPASSHAKLQRLEELAEQFHKEFQEVRQAPTAHQPNSTHARCSKTVTCQRRS